MSRALSVAALTITIALAASLPAGASGGSATGTLNLNANLPTAAWQNVSCAAGTTGANPHCYSIAGQGVVAGLGQTSESYAFVIDDYQSGSSNFHFTATIDVPGKGAFDISGATPSPSCTCTPYGVTLDFTVTNGTGVYSGAHGSGTTVFNPRNALWSGTLGVPGYTFDTAAPVISGKVPRVVKAPMRARRARVRYTVTAQDPDEGSLPVSCKPRSGSLFKVGRRTSVSCTATDANGNTAQKRFSVKVERR